MANVPTEPPRTPAHQSRSNTELPEIRVENAGPSHNIVYRPGNSSTAVTNQPNPLCESSLIVFFMLTRLRNQQSRPSQKLIIPAFQSRSQPSNYYAAATQNLEFNQLLGSTSVSKLGEDNGRLSGYKCRPSTAPVNYLRDSDLRCSSLSTTKLSPALIAGTNNISVQQLEAARRNNLPESTTSAEFNGLKSTTKASMLNIAGDKPEFPLRASKESETAGERDVLMLQNATEQNAADDIDTQLLLAKVAARRSTLRKSQRTRNSPGAAVAASKSKDSPSSQKLKRNTACTNCRAARRKCERNPKSSSGPCRPCSDSAKECSLNSAEKRVDVNARITDNIKSKDEVAHTRSEYFPKLMQVPHLEMLGISSELPLASTENCLQVKTNAEPKQAIIAKKIPSVTPLTPHPGQTEARERAISRSVSGKMLGKQIHNDHQGLLHVNRSDPQETHNQLCGNIPSVYIRSDATTMSVDPNDLDTVRGPARKYSDAVSKPRFGSDCPTYSELTETRSAFGDLNTDCVRVHDNLRTSENKKNRFENQPASTSSSSGSIGKTLISDYSKMNETNRMCLTEDFLRHALSDDFFLELCKRMWLQSAFQVILNKV